ncbi:hypothetical protein THRCLA_03028 [Thraustotheca clavata]|uniref:Uncharacterized protein n=1 Tax=Thraustotheca clavata TaxID=74557 RepID=A0A1W0A3C4_9STRA|nr:hypothetical protein THRCLA_03028 [Thraustotheca clavata]
MSTLRQVTESEQVDLGGYTEARTRELVTAAFSEPFELNEMIRFTFVVGGGKLVRSKYPEELPKWMTGALRDIGFLEDRSAACTWDCQGTFKQQHDTGQNLKTILVFPKVVEKKASSAEQPAAKGPSVQEIPELLLLSCDLEDFEKLLPLELPSWTQKKRAVRFIQDAMNEFALLEAKMVRGEILTEAEQAQYDGNAGQEVNAAKLTRLQAEIKKHVDDGRLTANEKKELVATMTSNVDALTAEIESLSVNQKEKANKKLSNLTSRLNHVQNIKPIVYPLRKADTIMELHLALIPLQILQEKEHSMSLTLQDLKTLQGKKGIEVALYQAETESIEWFDDDFQEKCDRIAKEAMTKYKKKSSAKAKAPVNTGWATVPKKKPTTFRSSGPAKPSGSAFARAFGNDSDSD